MNAPMGAELLVGQTVRLTALAPSDAAAISTWYQDAEFLRMYDAVAAFPKSAQAVEKKIEAANKAENSFLFGIRRVSDDVLLGMAEIEGILWTHGCGWVAIALAKPYWGQGYGTAAMQLLLRYAYCELNLHRVQLTVFEYNQRARALYTKLGFKQEGAFREFLSRDGQRYDMLLMGLLTSEWRESNACGAPAETDA